MSSFKLKITAAGWDTFSGPMCGVAFTNGVSDNVVDRLTIDRISAIVTCDLVDENGNDLGQAGASARLVGSRSIEAPTDSLRLQTPEEAAAERKAAMDAALKNPASKIYTQDELEAIGTKLGIKGVREIGDKWGVKERSISKLIDLILAAQSEYQSKVKERDAAEKAQRDAATADALKQQAARQAAIDAQARVLTPNAPPTGQHQFTHAGITVDVTDPAPTTAEQVGQAAVAAALNVTPAPQAS